MHSASARSAWTPLGATSKNRIPRPELLISVALTAPATALLGVYDPPLFMVIFPRSRYGQY